MLIIEAKISDKVQNEYRFSISFEKCVREFIRCATLTFGCKAKYSVTGTGAVNCGSAIPQNELLLIPIVQ